MGILSDLNPFDAAINVIGSVINKIFPDANVREKAQAELLKMKEQGQLDELHGSIQIALAQAATNTAEAQGQGLFKSGWRPFIGWVCGFGFTYQYLGRPLIVWASDAWWHVAIPPAIDTSSLQTMLWGMLGLGVYRTAEKIKGAN